MNYYQYAWLSADLFGKSEEAVEYKSSSNMFELLGLIVLFAILLVACYYVTKFVGNKQMKQLKNSNFTIIDTYRVTQNKFLQMVKIGNRYIVIAVTKDQISLIAQLNEEEVLLPETHSVQDGAFKNVLSDLIKKKKDDEKVDKI